MKQKLLHQSLIATLVTMVLLLAGSSVSAQEEYGLTIAGVKVTSENCSDLTAIPGVTGRVSYDPTTKTLTLEDASIDGGNHDGMETYDELTCVVKGEVSITSNLSAMVSFKNAIIKGNGQLTIKAPKGSGIYTKAALLIEGCTVYAEGNWGIAGYDGSSGESLTIRNASVTAKGTKGSIRDLADLTLEGCEITKPAGAVWNASKHAVCDASGNVITDEVVITPTGGVTPPVEEYGLEIAGVMVNSVNCSDLTAISGVTGNVSYDPTTKTLTLEDASIDAGEDRRGICSTDELTCVVKGEVSITSNNWHAMMFYKNAIIKGTGQLTLKSREEGCGIYTEAALLIEGCTVYAEGVWGFIGNGGTSGESLTIRNASVTAKGTKGSICGLASFTLDGCEITKPAGAVWNDSKHAVCDASGNVIKDEVVITPPVPVEEYGLEIAGVQVTSENCSDLTAIPGVKGKVSYDPTTKTLTIEDASIDAGEDRRGICSTDELTCVVKGKVSITSNNWHAMVFFKNAIIKGNGQLTLKSLDQCGIYTKATLLIEGCTVYAEGKWGITGKDGTSGESLTIRNATVTAKGTHASIRDLANFTLDGCSITKPAGAVWNASKHAVCDASGNVITDEVVITPTGGVTPPVEEYGLKIAGVKVTSANCSDLSVIDGVTGKVTYDPATKTLTLEDASIYAGEDRLGIWSKDELTCVVKGEVSITSNNSSEMVFDKNALIKGNGQLTLKSSEQCGIYTEAALLIEGCTVYAEGKCGISGFDGSSGESLIIRNATVTAKGTKGSIRDLANFTLEGCEITKPAGAVWNASKHAVCDASGNVITDEVVIAPTGGVTPPVEEYGLLIAGVGVTSANCSDLSVIDGVTGKVTYDPTTKTLTLEDASIDGGEAGIWSNDELTCVVKGEVSITSNNCATMALYKNAIIKGNGQLTLKSSAVSGIYTKAALLIEGCTVYAEGNWGIAGESLTIRNASVTAKGAEGSICDLASFTLDGCSITKPAGAVWNASKHAVCDAAGNLITDQVVITPTGGVTPAVEEYGLAIASVQVTSANCSDLTAIPGVKGKVSYDPTTKTLTLEDASIDVGEGRHGISSTDELTCVVKGEVSITSNDRNAMVFGKNAIIKGNGQLTIKSSEYGGIITEAALLIEGCTVYAEGKWGIAGRNGTYGESLAIRNASVTAKGTKGSICDLTNFTLEGCSITKPAGAVWNASKHAVCDASGNVIKDEVVITPPVEKYTVTFVAEPAGQGTLTATGAADLTAVPYGTELTIVATPATGYELTALTANGTDILATKKFTVTADTEVKATFTKKTYAVTLTKEGEGTLTATGASNLNSVAYGTELTIVATPATGYELTALTANGTDILATKKVIVKEAVEVKATFTKKSFAVSLTKEGEGTITATGASNLNSVAYGTELTIVATPATGYELVSLTANGTDITATKKVVVKENLTVKATFAKKTFAVTLTSNEHGKIEVAESVDLKAVPYGTTLTVKATGKNAQCELTALTANGDDILATKSFVVKGATEVKATFVDHTSIDAVAADAFVIYPNPASESATVTGLAPEAAVALYTLDGQLITRLAADRSGRLQIDLTALSDGTYLVVTEGATQRLVVKH